MIKIKDTFLKLTSRRYPNGTEDLAMDIVKEILPSVIFKQDEFGNYFTIVKKSDDTLSDTMFTSHLDTIDNGPYNPKEKWDYDLKKMMPNPDYVNEIDDKSVTHVFEGVFIKTDGNTNLGADDKAGTTIMMNMISENVPGLYYFFLGEESGCIGSSSLSKIFEKLDLPIINRCVSFDRRGYDSIITHQGSQTSSDVFATELANRYNEYGFWYKPDPTGVYTDSAEFTYVISECTNISVGYFSEHTKTERQDIEFLELLAVVSAKIDWDTLPIVREKNKAYSGKKSYTSKYTGGTTSHNSIYDGHYFDGYGEYGSWGEESFYENESYVQNYNKNNDFNLNKKVNKKPEFNKNVETDIDEMEFEQWYATQKKKEFQD